VVLDASYRVLTPHSWHEAPLADPPVTTASITLYWTIRKNVHGYVHRNFQDQQGLVLGMLMKEAVDTKDREPMIGSRQDEQRSGDCYESTLREVWGGLERRYRRMAVTAHGFCIAINRVVVPSEDEWELMREQSASA